jgi:ribonuclease HI
MTYLRHTITVDFSGDHERQIAGIGIVIHESTKRGRQGSIVEELAEAVEGIPLGEGEKYAVLRALQIASERGFRDLKIRSDYNAMRRRLRRNYDRNALEDFHGTYLSDEEMQELKPIIRNAICTALYSFQNRHRSEAAKAFVEMTLKMVPEYWEKPDLIADYLNLEAYVATKKT